MESISNEIVGYFGKLPNFPDFVKFNSSGDELLTIDKWIQEGIINSKSKLKTEWENIYKNSPSYNFLFNYSVSKKILAGSLFPSKDRSSRYYPFLTLLKLEKSFFNFDNLFLLPVILENFYEKSLIFYEFAKKCNSNEEISNFIENLDLRIENYNAYKSVYDTYLQNTKLHEFWERIINGEGDSKILNMINNLLMISSIRTQHSNSNLSLTVKISFPIKYVFNIFDIAFFFNIVLKLINNMSPIPTLFWSYPDSGSFNSIYIIIGRLSPQNLHELIDPNYISGKTIDIRNNHFGEGLKYLSSELQTLFQNRSATLSEFAHSV